MSGSGAASKCGAIPHGAVAQAKRTDDVVNFGSIFGVSVSIRLARPGREDTMQHVARRSRAGRDRLKAKASLHCVSTATTVAASSIERSLPLPCRLLFHITRLYCHFCYRYKLTGTATLAYGHIASSRRMCREHGALERRGTTPSTDIVSPCTLRRLCAPLYLAPFHCMYTVSILVSVVPHFDMHANFHVTRAGRFKLPPIDEVSLEEFELFAVDRLRGTSVITLTRVSSAPSCTFIVTCGAMTFVNVTCPRPSVRLLAGSAPGSPHTHTHTMPYAHSRPLYPARVHCLFLSFLCC